MLQRRDEVSPWLAGGEITDKRLVIMTQPFAHMIYGRLLLEQGEYQKLLGVSEFGLGLSAIFPNLLPQIYINLYRAQALYAIRKRPQALEALNNALDIALPDGILLPFAENYEGVKRLLPDSSCDGKVAEKIAELSRTLFGGLAAFVQKELTPREKEVLMLIEEGLTNPGIAERLHISLSTAKATVSSVLSKKGVSSRELLKNKK